MYRVASRFRLCRRVRAALDLHPVGERRGLTPAFAPLGIREDNWPAVVGVFSGVLAKEAVVGSLDALYTRMAQEQAGSDAASSAFDLSEALAEAAASVPRKKPSKLLLR